ncbi:MAG TPA: hypothetical protein VJV79_18030 [Polyangiaceae bacterium]|nr:hypothetical protein [Polyangiaceae bacterium]
MATKKPVKVSGSARATIDHDEIREWVESHGGRPAMVKSTARSGRGGILRIDFPGFSGEGSLEEVGWDEFFEKFEESELAFLYQDRTASARPSRFNKLVSRASLADGAQGGRQRGARPQKVAKKTARRANASPATTAKKRPAKRASSAQGRTPAATKSARSASARGAGQRPGTLKKKAAARQTKKRAQA